MFSRQTQKLLFMFVAYSFIGYFIDSMVNTGTWIQTQNVTGYVLPHMAYFSWMYGLGALVIYYVLKMKNFGRLPKLLMSALILVLIGCAMKYGQNMLFDPVNTTLSCISARQVIMWMLMVFAFQMVNKPLLRMVFGKKGAN